VLDVRPVVLEGEILRLEPLTEAHIPAMLGCTKSDYFKLFPYPKPSDDSPEDISRFLQEVIGLPFCLAYVMMLKESGEPVGSSSYLDIRSENRGLEIGRTWIMEDQRGTKVNPECKLLMLQHAFETLGCIRVQLKTDGRNLHSQRAIEKLGAVKEGTLRNHLIMPDGYQRDSVMYSILPDEWRGIRERLLERLGIP
jgi:N-acetyltransferase